MKIAYHNAVANVLTGAAVVADITVYEPGTTETVTIYSDSSGSLQDNPFTTDDYGRFVFYANPGMYDIKISGDDIDDYTLTDVPIVAFTAVPSGKYMVTGLYVDPTTGKLDVSYDTEAV